MSLPFSKSWNILGPLPVSRTRIVDSHSRSSLLVAEGQDHSPFPPLPLSLLFPVALAYDDLRRQENPTHWTVPPMSEKREKKNSQIPCGQRTPIVSQNAWFISPCTIQSKVTTSDCTEQQLNDQSKALIHQASFARYGCCCSGGSKVCLPVLRLVCLVLHPPPPPLNERQKQIPQLHALFDTASSSPVSTQRIPLLPFEYPPG